MPREKLTETRLFTPLSVKLTEDVRLADGTVQPGVIREVTGVFQNYLEENSNKRVYPKHLWESILREDSPFMERLRNRQVYGVVEHPGDSTTRAREISHVITEVHFASPDEIAASKTRPLAEQLIEGDIVGTYEIVETEAGKDLAALHRAKVGLGISSRGDGNVTKKGNSYLVEEFELDTWDAVANPSVKRARPRPVMTEAEQPNKPAESALTEGEGERTKLEEMNPQLFYRRKRRKKDFHPSDDEVITEMRAYAGRFQKLEEGIESYLEDYPEKFPEAILEAVRKPVEEERRSLTESTTPTPTTMSEKIAKMRQLKGKTLQLCETSIKGLKFHAKAALLEEVTTLRSELGPLHEDASTRFEAEALNKRLFEFEEDLGAEEAPPLPPGPGAGADAPPAPGADDPIDAPLPDQVQTALQDAADTIEQLTGPDDQEAQDLIGELRGFVDSGGDEVLDEPGADFVDEIPALTESGKKARKQAALALKESAANKLVHKALTFSSRKMLEAHHKLKAKAKKGLTESVGGHTAQDWKTAANELAETYNKDMTSTTLQLVEAKEPKLYEKHGVELKKHRTYKALKEALDKARKDFSPDSTTLTEAEKAAAQKKLTESAPNKDGKGGASTPLNESEVHPSVQFVNRRRK